MNKFFPITSLLFFGCEGGRICLSLGNVALFLTLFGIPTIIILIALFSRKTIRGRGSPPSHILTLCAIISGIIATCSIVALFFQGIMGFTAIAEIIGIPVAILYFGYIANIIFHVGFVSIVLYLDYLHKRIQRLEDNLNNE